MQSLPDGFAALDAVAQKQLFFVGGAPRSGTTWLQHVLDCHPRVSCSGEGLFLHHLALPLDRLLAARTRALQDKNARVFAHSGGYKLPQPADADVLLRAAILLALHHQALDKPCLAIGEKTPENVFLFPRLKRLFPAAKFIGIARDPRDALASAWHFFHANAASADTMMAFIESALPSVAQGARSMLALADSYPADCTIVTYEALRRAPEAVVAALFRFLGVDDGTDVIRHCVARSSFAAMTETVAGAGQDGAFFRKGMVGTWAATLTPAMGALVLRELGWMFPRFGWQA